MNQHLRKLSSSRLLDVIPTEESAEEFIPEREEHRANAPEENAEENGAEENVDQIPR